MTNTYYKQAMKFTTDFSHAKAENDEEAQEEILESLAYADLEVLSILLQISGLVLLNETFGKTDILKRIQEKLNEQET